MSLSYNRNTELRNVDSKDLYNLALILDDGNYWKTLMEIIPRKINNQAFGTAEDLENIATGATYERKYNSDHIRLIENAILRPGESRLYSQILFDEWGTSGRKHERPTLGVLLHLLVQSKHYRAADFVSDLLKEPKAPRPKTGPAAEFEFEIDVFNDIQETVNDTRFYPNTEELQECVNIDINKDYYTKYHKLDKVKPILKDNTNEPVPATAPIPPPRLVKSARLLKQQQQLQEQQINQSVRQNNKSNNYVLENSKQEPNSVSQLNNASISALTVHSTYNVPKFSALLNTNTNELKTESNSIINSNTSEDESSLNNSSETISKPNEVEDEYDSLNSFPSLIYTRPNTNDDQILQYPDLNNIPIIVLSKGLSTDSQREEIKSNNDIETQSDLPAISALNLNGDKDNSENQQLRKHQNYNFENVSSVVLDLAIQSRSSVDNYSVINDDVLNIPLQVDDDYNGIERGNYNDVEAELEDDEDSIPNLSFLENRSSNNESSLTSVTNTSGENSFEQSVNDCSSASADNLP